MREIIGMPQRVLGASLQHGSPIWSVLFQYATFPCIYESGENGVPIFDAHIEVYSENKIVRVSYDTPYVKGLPVTLRVRERVPGHAGQTDGFQERTVRRTYEDPYHVEFLEFWEVVTKGKKPKTSAEDARNEMVLIEMIIKAGYGK